MSGMCRSTRADKPTARQVWKGASYKGKTFTRNNNQSTPHPCARRLQHVIWLVHQFSDKQVLDPFMGSGTTLVAAKQLNRQAIGIEISEALLMK